MKKEKPVSSDRRQFLKKTARVGVGVGAGLAVAGSLTQGGASAETVKSYVRWGFLIDLTRCTGCNACVVACKTENDVRLGLGQNPNPDGVGLVRRAWVGVQDSGPSRSFRPQICNHCAKPACLKDEDGKDVCPVDPIPANLEMPDGTLVRYEKRATYQRPDGLVLVDQDRCIGCGNCVRHCPYGARYQDPSKFFNNSSRNGLADKCTLCMHRITYGHKPACVDTCPAKARLAGDVQDQDSEISKALADRPTEVLFPEFGTEPFCFYVGLT